MFFLIETDTFDRSNFRNHFFPVDLLQLEVKAVAKRQAEPTEAEAEALPLQQRAQGIAEALPALARLSGSVVTW